MTRLRPAFALLLGCLACERAATSRTDTVAAASTTSSPTLTPAVEGELVLAADEDLGDVDVESDGAGAEAPVEELADVEVED